MKGEDSGWNLLQSWTSISPRWKKSEKQGTGAKRHDATTEVRELKSGSVELGAEGRRSSQRVDAIELINTISKEQYTPVHGGKEEPPERREFIVARDKILRERPKNKLPDEKAS